MFQKLIVTTDLSECANAALAPAAELARQFGGELYLVHVFESDIYYAAGLSPDRKDDSRWPKTALQQREKMIAEAAAKLANATAVKVTPVLREGNAAEEIVAFAKKEKADCIVIASRGRSGLERMLFGSVAQRVLQLSACKVLVVK